MALEGVRDVEAKEGTTHSSECERRERGQHYQETGREGPGAVRLVVGRAVWVVGVVRIPLDDLVEVEAVVVIVGRGTPGEPGPRFHAWGSSNTLIASFVRRLEYVCTYEGRENFVR